MALASLKKVVRWLRTPAPVGRTPFPHRRLRFEMLEDRLTPAANYWSPTTVAGGTAVPLYFWSDPSNWSLGHAPQASDDLFFSNLTTRSGSNPNIATGISAYTSTVDMPTVTVNSINFEGIASLTLADSSAVGYRIANLTGMTSAITVNGVGTPGLATRNQATFAANPTDNSKLTAWIYPQANFASGGTIQVGGDTSSSLLQQRGTDTLKLLGTVSNGNGGLTVKGVQSVGFFSANALSGSGGLTVSDSSLSPSPTLNVQLNGAWVNAVVANGVVATTTVNQGTLNLASETGATTPGSLVIGKGKGLASVSPVTAPGKGSAAGGVCRSARGASSVPRADRDARPEHLPAVWRGRSRALGPERDSARRTAPDTPVGTRAKHSHRIHHSHHRSSVALIFPSLHVVGVGG